MLHGNDVLYCISDWHWHGTAHKPDSRSLVAAAAEAADSKVNVHHGR